MKGRSWELGWEKQDPFLRSSSDALAGQLGLRVCRIGEEREEWHLPRGRGSVIEPWCRCTVGGWMPSSVIWGCLALPKGSRRMSGRLLSLRQWRGRQGKIDVSNPALTLFSRPSFSPSEMGVMLTTAFRRVFLIPQRSEWVMGTGLCHNSDCVGGGPSGHPMS